MRRMKYKIGAFCLLAIGLWGCLEDKGVYDYDFDVAPEIKIDTVGTDKTELFRTWEIGDTIHFTPRVTYSKPENLVYRWFVMDSDYKPETVGNTTVYRRRHHFPYTRSELCGESRGGESLSGVDDGQRYGIQYDGIFSGEIVPDSSSGGF